MTSIPVTVSTILLSLLCSCSTPVLTVRSKSTSDTVTTVRIHRDSIYIRDSIMALTRNDTVFVDRTRYVYKYRIKTDTLHQHSCDTIFRTVPTAASGLQAPYSLRDTVTGIVILAAAVILIRIAISKI